MNVGAVHSFAFYRRRGRGRVALEWRRRAFGVREDGVGIVKDVPLA